MLPTAIVIAAVLACLWLLWSYIAIREIQSKMVVVDYALNVGYYNDMVIEMNSREAVSPEEEFNLALLQDQLTKQAESIGMKFLPVSRPRGLAGPD